EINEIGFLRISTCYMQGIKRLNAIYRQEILKIEERIVKGRREHNVNTYKLSNLLIHTDKKRKISTDSDSKTITNDNEKTPSTKRIRRSTSSKAKEILSQLLIHKSFAEDDQLLYEVLRELQDIELGWDKERVITYWRNHHNK
ncbi:5551_t:CDS:1, partial [Cetraspora pellucida]